MKILQRLLLVKEIITWLVVYSEDLSKQPVLDFDPKAMQQNNFTGNLDHAGHTAVFFIIEKAKQNNILWILYKELWEYYKTFQEFILVWYNMRIKWLNIKV